MTDETTEWAHWNSLESFRLYELIYLQHGVLPPKNMDYLSYEERHEWYHNIVTMADFDDDFRRMLSLLRTDKDVGKEFRDIEENKKAAFHHVTKSIFIEHWKKCGFRFHRKFQIDKQGQGRPKKIDVETLSRIAQECASRKKEYAEFIRAVVKEFDCSPSRAKELFPAKTYKQL